jgi:hypothetical protein
MAYDPKAFGIAQEMLGAESSKRLQRLDEEIGRVKSEAAMRGALNSSGMIYGIADVCANEIESGTTHAWQVVHRMLVNTGVQASPGLADALKREMEDILRIYCLSEPERRFTGALTLANLGPREAQATNFFNRATSARMRILTEVDLFARSLERQASESYERPGTTIINYAPVGSIQTGANAHAEIAQHFGDHDRRAIVDTLERIEGDLRAAKDLTGDSAIEISEVVAEVRNEVEKSKPNRFLLLPKLQALAASIEAVKSLAGGYQILKAILAAHGITLP